MKEILFGLMTGIGTVLAGAGVYCFVKVQMLQEALANLPTQATGLFAGLKMISEHAELTSLIEQYQMPMLPLMVSGLVCILLGILVTDL